MTASTQGPASRPLFDPTARRARPGESASGGAPEYPTDWTSVTPSWSAGLTVGDGTQVGRYRLEEPKLLRYQGYIFFGFSTSIGFVSPTLAVPTGFTLDGGWYADLGDFEVSIGSRLWFGKPSPAGNAVVCFVADPSDLNAVKILSSTYPDTFASSSVIQWDLRITLA